MSSVGANIIILDAQTAQARQIAGWLRSAGLGSIAIAGTCDEALFLLGRKSVMLLVIDDGVSVASEQRLLRHIESCGHTQPPALVRLVGPGPDHDGAGGAPAPGRALADEIVRKPVDAHDIVVRVGNALDRPDLLGRMDSARDQSDASLANARRMQLGLLPTAEELAAMQAPGAICLAAFCRFGEAVGGDFWGVWPTTRGRFALALADFVGHGFGAALNTFRLHAILSEEGQPRTSPVRMTRLLNRRLNLLLQRGQYATMIYAHVDPERRQIEWCSAGGPPPMMVSVEGIKDLDGRGLPLGIKADAEYRSYVADLPESGILCLFSDGLYEAGAGTQDITRTEIAAVLERPARLAAAGRLAEATQRAIAEVEALRDRHPCLDHSDDIMFVCVALGPPKQ